MMSTAIVCEKRIYNEVVTSHHHTHGQFLFPLHGSMDLKTDNHKINLSPEHCFYLAPIQIMYFILLIRMNFSYWIFLCVCSRVIPVTCMKIWMKAGLLLSIF